MCICLLWCLKPETPELQTCHSGCLHVSEKVKLFFPLKRSLDLSDYKVMTASSGKVISHPLKHKRHHVITFLNRTVTWLKLWRSK